MNVMQKKKERKEKKIYRLYPRAVVYTVSNGKER
jgi:hypothetical protein